MSEETPTEEAAPPPRESRGNRRIQQLTADLSAAHERIAALEADGVTKERDALLEARTALEAKLERMTAEHAAAREQWATNETMLRRGLVSEEGQAVALALYARLPEDGRPALGAWFDAMVTEDTDNTPAALRPYLERNTGQAVAPAPSSAPLAGTQPAGSPGALGSVPASVRAAAARGDKDAQEAIRAYLAGRR